MFEELRGGPCGCMCHDQKGVMHIMACCAYTGMPRKEAEAVARGLPEDEVLQQMAKLSPHEIHEMATDGTLFEKFPWLDEVGDEFDLSAPEVLFKDVVPYTPGGNFPKKD